MRAFIAIEVPDSVKERVLSVSKDLTVSGIVPVKKEALHITLQFLGEISEGEEVERAKLAMSAVRVSPFEASLSGISYFSPNFIKIIFAEVVSGKGSMQTMYRQLRNSLILAGLRAENEEFVPHLTMARVKRAPDRDALLNFINRNAATDFGSFSVGSFVLKKSTLTPEGPVYEELHEQKL